MRVMIADDAVLFREDLARVLQAVSEVADAVRRVAAGGSVIDPEVSRSSSAGDAPVTRSSS